MGGASPSRLILHRFGGRYESPLRHKITNFDDTVAATSGRHLISHKLHSRGKPLPCDSIGYGIAVKTE